MIRLTAPRTGGSGAHFEREAESCAQQGSIELARENLLVAAELYFASGREFAAKRVLAKRRALKS